MRVITAKIVTLSWIYVGRKFEMTPASDESTDTHARKVAETAEVVERGLARRGMAVLSRWNSAPSLACNAFLKNFP